ncbi:hypothetical protein [Couchioplanes azureus]|uniref:hypothetical protein n=1 Tax=Couchioplanes caeruleus TaxID=56438 RepID=UPI0016706FB4|nr:hypothetical protein [Couchioplanes caeruleus]GGQ44127.1 hypothetical protein GCM10010166_10800 [Couchioplanes caeruleus subsp. azureus]
MGFLASLLPGIRDLRAPMAAGLLWLGVLFIQFGENPGSLIVKNEHTDALGKTLKTLPAYLVIAALVAGAFLVGAVANTVTGAVLRLAGRSLMKGLNAIGGEFRPDGLMRRPTSLRRFYRSLRRLYLSCESFSATARSLIADTVASVLGKAKVPGEAAMLYPLSHAISQTRYSGPQLAVTAPTLYQDFDRAKAESELRLAIVPPLLVLAAVAPINSKWWIFIAVSVGSVVLISQAIGQQRAANDILANAAYLSQIPLPAVQSLADFLENVDPQPQGTAEWLGAIMWSMEQLAQMEAAEEMAREVVTLEDEDAVYGAMAYLIRRKSSSHLIAMELLRRTDSGRSKMLYGRLLAVSRHPDRKAAEIPRLVE